MNILLWILQAVLAWLAIGGGAFQILKIDQLKKTVAAMRALPRGVWAVLGAIGCVAGVGLILPGAIGAVQFLTPLSAAILAVHSLLVSAIYVRYGDRASLPYSLAMAVIAGFVAYGRYVLSPI